MSFSPKQSVQKRILVSLTALTLTAVLAGCSSDNEADLDTTETPDVETEYIPASADGPAQNVPEPKLPAVATENTEEGAEATLEYFWEAVDYARLTGETSQLETVSTESCDFCAGLIDDWDDAYAEGYWAVADGGTTLDLSGTWVGIEEDRTDPSADVLFNLSEAAVELYKNDGEIDQTSDGSEMSVQWFAILLYDATKQRWEIDWIGLEDLVDWEENE